MASIGKERTASGKWSIVLGRENGIKSVRMVREVSWEANDARRAQKNIFVLQEEKYSDYESLADIEESQESK